MRDLRDYSPADWKRLRPITHAYKTALYRIQTAQHIRRRAPDLPALLERIDVERRAALAITIAYEAPWVIRLQLVASARHLRDTTLVVCDNSRQADKAVAIAAVAEEAGFPYLRLPRCPVGAGSRSHALAANWAYRNVVCVARPAAFLFLDHDLIPTRPVRPAELVSSQPIYGLSRNVGARWFLWAGYSVFDGCFAASPVLDFSQDWFYGLDTGGANYRRLYRHMGRAQLAFASYRREERVDPTTGRARTVEFVDDWLHLVNASGWDPDSAPEAAAAERIVAAALAT